MKDPKKLLDVAGPTTVDGSGGGHGPQSKRRLYTDLSLLKL